MRRSLPLFASLVLTAAVVAGCGSDGNDTATSRDDNDDDMSAPSDGGSDTGGHDAGGHGEASSVADGARRIAVSAGELAFDPAEIRVSAGEDIAIALTSDDMVHDFTIDELGAHVPADAGETSDGGFRAPEPGRYPFYCSVAGHREAGMEGVLVVE